MGIFNASTNIPFKSFIMYLLAGIPIYALGCYASAVLIVNFYNKFNDYLMLFILYFALALIGGWLIAKGVSEWKKIDNLEYKKAELESKRLELENKKLEIEIQKLEKSK